MAQSVSYYTLNSTSPSHYDTCADTDHENQNVFDFTEESIRKAFIKKVYGILTCQLLVTLVIIMIFVFTESVKAWAKDNRWFLGLAIVVGLAIIITMSCYVEMRRKVPTNYIFLGIFTLSESVILGFSSATYDTDVVLMAVGVTAAVCLALTLFAFQTKWDFTTMGGILFCCVIVFILFSILAAFLYNRILTVVLSCFGVLLFSFYLVYDTQKMMGGKHKYSTSPEEYVFAALNLYLDIVILFSYILRIFGR